jgi:hypothetical protein
MVEDRTRIEIAFEGGAAIGVLISAESADALEQALDDGNDDTFRLEAEDGEYTVALQRVVYVKRFARDSRVGFGTA